MESAQENMKSGQKSAKKHEDELPGVWGAAQGVIWVLGIAFLAWTDWWWPGIMVLVAISMIAGAVMRRQVDKHQASARVAAEEKVIHAARAEALPERCTACGAQLTARNVIWRSQTTASCPYCDTAVKATKL